MEENKTVEISVRLLDEGTNASRRTQAIPLAGGLYKILPAWNYDPEDETWEFLPGSIVRCERNVEGRPSHILLAVEKVG